VELYLHTSCRGTQLK